MYTIAKHSKSLIELVLFSFFSEKEGGERREIPSLSFLLISHRISDEKEHTFTHSCVVLSIIIINIYN